jgi:hypothetical protein
MTESEGSFCEHGAPTVSLSEKKFRRMTESEQSVQKDFEANFKWLYPYENI